jgi:hypothetical protein
MRGTQDGQAVHYSDVQPRVFYPPPSLFFLALRHAGTFRMIAAVALWVVIMVSGWLHYPKRMAREKGPAGEGGAE